MYGTNTLYDETLGYSLVSKSCRHRAHSVALLARFIATVSVDSAHSVSPSPITKLKLHKNLVH